MYTMGPKNNSSPKKKHFKRKQSELENYLYKDVH